MNKPVKVAAFSPFLLLGGGVEQWLYSLASHLPPEDVEFIGVGILPFKGYCRWDVEGVELLLPKTSVVIGKRASQKLMEEADVLLTWYATSLKPWFGEHPNKPTAFVNHGNSDYCARIIAEASKWADEIVCVGDAARAVSPRGIVIPNGVELSRCVTAGHLRVETRLKYGIPLDAFVYGQIGRLLEEKDSMAVARAVAATPGSWGLLMGNPIRQSYIESAKETAQGRLVHIPAGPVIAGALSAMDVFVFSSIMEGFGLAIVEAWAAGVPTVSTEVGVCLSHRDCTQFIPLYADGFTIMAAAKKAIADQGTVLRARAVARGLYSSVTMAERWRDLFLRLATKRDHNADRMSLPRVTSDQSADETETQASA